MPVGARMTARPLATTSLQCSRGHGSVHRTGSRGQPRDKGEIDQAERAQLPRRPCCRAVPSRARFPASSDLVRLSSSMTAARVPLLGEGGIDGVADLDAATLVGRLVKACPAYDQPPLRGEDQASDPDRRQRVSVNLGCTTLPGRAPCGHHVVGQPKLRGPLGTARTSGPT